MVFEYTILLISIIISLVYYWAYQRKTYWKRQNVPYIDAPILLGHFAKTMFLQEHIEDTFDRLYNHPKAKDEPFIGVNLFHKPILLIRDPELVKMILIKDFHYFSNRHTSGNPKTDPIGANNLFQIKNPMWKQIRNKLSPMFTIGRMKLMFYMIEKVGNNLNEEVKRLIVENKSNEIEVKALCARYTIDVVAIVAFGTEANCIRQPKTSEFFKNTMLSFMSTTWTKLQFNAIFYLPQLMSLLRLKTFHPDYERFLRELLNEVMAERINSGAVRHDLVDILIAIKDSEKNSKNTVFNDDVILAQAIVFLAAGFETSSTTIALNLYEIAKDQEVKNKIRDEIKAMLKKYNGQITYEALMNDLPYLNAVVSETLRMYPILGLLDRICSVPSGQEGYSLEPFSKFKIPNNMPVYIPVTAFHKDPSYFPEPLKFNPDRFMAGSESFNEYTYMPFGLGPRNCIGDRLGMMQVKTALYSLLKSFDIELGSGNYVPMKFDETCILYRAKGGIRIKFHLDEL